MTAIYIHESRAIPYASAVAGGYKPLETRSRDVLGRFLGQRVLIIRTRDGHKPDVIGSAFVSAKQFYSADQLDTDELRNKTLIPPGSKYDHHGRGKWAYTMNNPVLFSAPVPLSDFEITHKTRSFAILKIA